MKKHLSTDPYKGVRDFYPEDMAIQNYIFETWAKTAESFGFNRYDASLLESADIYRSKGAENEEMVNEQTYTFIDRGEREVTLRPEMTPTVARLIAGRQHQLKLPVKWYSIPNLFRYERPQRGRLREHWQLNCDVFGTNSIAADIEIISLANQVLLDFNAKPQMFEVRVNSRSFMDEWYSETGITDNTVKRQFTKLNDRKDKISADDYKNELVKILGGSFNIEKIKASLEDNELSKIRPEAPIRQVIEGLKAVGIDNVRLDMTLARGFDYYTGTIFEIFSTDKENNRSMIGGGRYDNLTALFSDKIISGVGFGMGDVTTRDFLETHGLLPDDLKLSPHLTIIPTDESVLIDSLRIAQSFRDRSLDKSFRVNLDYGTTKLGKKIGNASENQSIYVLVIGSEEINQGNFTIKKLATGETISGGLDDLIVKVLANTK